MGHIPTKLHQFLISSFRDFVRTDTQTPAKTIPAHSMHAGNYWLRQKMEGSHHLNLLNNRIKESKSTDSKVLAETQLGRGNDQCL